MSTTGPSVAKLDGFAIGSISKRDRSGSGDEAAPVYPVKHPTMSYAGAAKGRPAAQSSNLFNYYSTSNSKNYQKNQQNTTKQQKNVKTQKPLKNSLPDYNPQKAVDESIYHWYTGGEKQKLKKLCMGGSECKIGCSWDQFGDNASDAVESICRQLFDLRMTMQHDRPSKSTYYIVKDEQAAERLLNGPLFYEGKKIEFFQTVHYEEEVMIITVPSFKDVQGETLFKAACKTLSKYGTVKDESARFVRGTSTMVPFGMKILFAKSSEKDMPNFIKVQKSRVGMFWRGCTPSCNYCKKYGHWKSECPEILQKNQNKKFQKQKTQPKNMTTEVPIQREISDFEPKSANVDTSKSESAKDADIQSSNKQLYPQLKQQEHANTNYKSIPNDSGKKLATKTKAEATKSSTSANIQQINTEVALSNTAELMQQQTNIDEMEVEVSLNEVKQGMTAEIASNPESVGLNSPQIINITGDLPDGTASVATDTVHATVNTASTVAYNVQSSKGDTGHEKIEVVSSDSINLETPILSILSSPGLDGFNLRNQFNKMYDGAYATIDPIDQSVNKSFFNREIIKELGVIGDPIPDFSDGMDEDLLE
ncbi:hypothetical protein BB560_006564 [Smittium megazygosporum]|uniref:CCHC-type domain-containing protein n=1 Tax=Smittium megazygosporum TaxID=133381 RepID=A0A2T9Y3Y5_9FUNG|nr:hypothetical protein BB560_006564 [Smittium megazygosporum]